MNAHREPLDVQMFDLADQVLDLGAELLALRELLEEHGVVVEDHDVLVRTLRFKARLTQDHGLVNGRLRAMESSRVEQLLGGE